MAQKYSGTYMSISYKDMIDQKRSETKTSEEIINNIRNKLEGLQ